MKKVLITIRGTQGIEDEKQTVEFMTRGSLRKTADNDLVLCYNDSQILREAGGKSVRTRLTVGGGDRVTIEREGDLSSRIVIEKGVRSSCLYRVSGMDLTLGIYGKTVKNALDENGGSVFMAYAIDADLHPVSENTIEITVKEVN